MEYELNQIIEYEDVYPEGLYEYILEHDYTLKALEPLNGKRRVQIVEIPKPTEEEIRQRIMDLRMTPLDFLKAIIKLGISYDTIKQLMEANPEVDMEMRYCQNVYRKHPMLEQFATQFGVTSEQLDNIFIEANGGY